MLINIECLRKIQTNSFFGETMKIAYIYTLSDPRFPDKIRYVGKTNNPRRRLRQHINTSLRHVGNNRKDNWIKSVVKEGYEPVINIIETIYYQKEKDWSESEIKWILYYRESGHPLTNISKGGIGLKGFKFSKKTIKTRSEALKGHLVSQQTRDKISKANKGKGRHKYTEEQKKNHSLNMLKRKLTPDQKNKMLKGLTSKEYTQKRLDSKKNKLELLTNIFLVMLIYGNESFLNYLVSENRKNYSTRVFKGEEKTLTEWANELNMKLSTLQWRINKGWSEDRIFNTQSQKKNKLYNFCGTEKTLKDWSSELNLTIQSLKYRIDNGWSEEKIINTPSKIYSGKD